MRLALPLAAILPLASHAQVPKPTSAQTEREPLIALDASPMTSGKTFQINWLTDYGSIDYTSRASKALDLDARNLSPHPSGIVLQWIFTARVPGGKGRFIFDMGERPWNLGASQEVHLGVQSAQLSSRTVIYAALGQGSYDGAEMDGWIVVVRFHDKIIKALGSSSTLESLVSTKELDGMIADYKKALAAK